MFQVDETVKQLTAIAMTEGMLGDTMRAAVAASMLELYVCGMIDVTFDEQGDPIATMTERSTPLVPAPMFVTPSLVPPSSVDEPRQIGFKSDAARS